jgi:hypothetical protein
MEDKSSSWNNSVVFVVVANLDLFFYKKWKNQLMMDVYRKEKVEDSRGEISIQLEGK